MTNEALKNTLSIIDTLLDDAITDSTRQKVKDNLTEVCQLAMKALDQEDVIGKIREEVEAYQADAFYPNDVMMHKRTVLQIIDKYREGGAE